MSFFKWVSISEIFVRFLQNLHRISDPLASSVLECITHSVLRILGSSPDTVLCFTEDCRTFGKTSGDVFDTALEFGCR